jgi:hypothetical protein
MGIVYHRCNLFSGGTTPSVKGDSVVVIIQHLQYIGNDYDVKVHTGSKGKNFTPRKKEHPVSFTGHFTAVYEQPVPLNRKLHWPRNNLEVAKCWYCDCCSSPIAIYTWVANILRVVYMFNGYVSNMTCECVC